MSPRKRGIRLTHISEQLGLFRHSSRTFPGLMTSPPPSPEGEGANKVSPLRFGEGWREIMRSFRVLLRLRTAVRPDWRGFAFHAGVEMVDKHAGAAKRVVYHAVLVGRADLTVDIRSERPRFHAQYSSSSDATHRRGGKSDPASVVLIEKAVRQAGATHLFGLIEEAGRQAGTAQTG